MTIKEKKSDKEVNRSIEPRNRYLVLYNDNYNTFDHVANTLSKVCNHDTTQASQCTYIAHYKGECIIKEGLKENLAPMENALGAYGLNVEIR